MGAINYVLLFCWKLLLGSAPADGFCQVKNTTTQNGEALDYTVYYSVAGIYAAAGSATFSTALETLEGKTVYHMTSSGRSGSRYDWIYKVRDRYESYIDTATMLPLRFLRDVQEGSTKKKERIEFNRSDGTATTDSGVYKVTACIQDVLSAIYFARNIDWGRYSKEDKIPFTMFLENEAYPLYLRYLGREEITTRYGKFSTFKCRLLLVPGTIFTGGENMTVWVSDDANRIPVRVESAILIGSIKVDMTGYRNIRHPLSGLRKKK